MSAQSTATSAAGPDERWLYRVGGISALVIGAAYILTILLYARVGAPPTGGAAWLEYLPGKTADWSAIIGVSVLTNFLYIPVALALYSALKPIHRHAMRIAVAFVGLFVVLEPAVNWPSYAALVVLGGDHAAATNDAQRAALVAAASYPSAVLASRLAVVYAIGTLSFGFLLTGLVMLRGVFSRVTAYLGIATGILGLAAVAGIGAAVVPNAVCATVWVFLVGYRLYRLAQQ